MNAIRPILDESKKALIEDQQPTSSSKQSCQIDDSKVYESAANESVHIEL